MLFSLLKVFRRWLVVLEINMHSRFKAWLSLQVILYPSSSLFLYFIYTGFFTSKIPLWSSHSHISPTPPGNSNILSKLLPSYSSSQLHLLSLRWAYPSAHLRNSPITTSLNSQLSLLYHNYYVINIITCVHN